MLQYVNSDPGRPVPRHTACCCHAKLSANNNARKGRQSHVSRWYCKPEQVCLVRYMMMMMMKMMVVVVVCKLSANNAGKGGQSHVSRWYCKPEVGWLVGCLLA